MYHCFCCILKLCVRVYTVSRDQVNQPFVVYFFRANHCVVIAPRLLTFRRHLTRSLKHYTGSSCVDANLAFAKCKSAHSDPEACLKLGAAVLKCNNKV